MTMQDWVNVSQIASAAGTLAAVAIALGLGLHEGFLRRRADTDATHTFIALTYVEAVRLQKELRLLLDQLEIAARPGGFQLDAAKALNTAMEHAQKCQSPTLDKYAPMIVHLPKKIRLEVGTAIGVLPLALGQVEFCVQTFADTAKLPFRIDVVVKFVEFAQRGVDAIVREGKPLFQQ